MNMDDAYANKTHTDANRLGPSEYGAHLYKRYHKAIAFARLRLKSNTPRVSILLLAA